MGLLNRIRRDRHERAGFALYGACVTTARASYLYTALHVPDTLDGRFDLVCIHCFLLIRRLQREAEPGPALAQSVFDAMFSDMDVNLREMGVGDLSVGRKVRVMWEAFHGRSAAYARAMAENDKEALEAALIRNVWRGDAPAENAARRLRQVMLAQSAHLDGQELGNLAEGKVSFLPAETLVE